MHFRARSYDPRLGRFVQKDAGAIRAALAHYVHARNHPTKFVDPTGRIEIDVAPDYAKRTIPMPESRVKRIQEGRDTYYAKRDYIVSTRDSGAREPTGERIMLVELNPNRQDRVTVIAREQASDANDILASGVNDFVAKLKERVSKSGERVTRLRFYGHGGGANVDIGGNDESLTIQSVQGIAKSNPDISDLFAEHASIEFWTCDLGAGPEGQRFLATVWETFLSKRSGRVSGFSRGIAYGEDIWGGNRFRPEYLEGGAWVIAVRGAFGVEVTVSK